jgi:adenylosuccinate lyase
MRHIWSEEYRRRLMRKLWVSLAAAQHKAGLVTAEQLDDLRRQEDRVDIERAQVIEKQLHHDVMAEIHTFSEQAPIGAPIIHWGATSADVIDNVDVLRQREALRLVSDRLVELLRIIADLIEHTADLPVMAHTHIQPAEPTTMGYRFAVYGQDLLESYRQIQSLINSLRGKGLKGAVGTQASFSDILRGTEMTPQVLEALVMQDLDLPYYPIATQTYTRQQDLILTQILASLAASLHKFALDFRILQSPPFGEWSEPFAIKQVGSSAMPFKRNPINTENICSLARFVSAAPGVMWENASQAILERSLDDSANRRIALPECFLATDEMLHRFARIIRGIVINEQAVERNMEQYGPFAATERILMGLVAAGADRQEAHEWLRENSLNAWQAIQDGSQNPLQQLLIDDGRIGNYVSAEEIATLMEISSHTGTASDRALALAQQIKRDLSE